MKYLTGPELHAYLNSIPNGKLATVARAIGMTPQALSRIKVSKTINPTWNTIKKVSEYKAKDEGDVGIPDNG